MHIPRGQGQDMCPPLTPHYPRDKVVHRPRGPTLVTRLCTALVALPS